MRTSFGLALCALLAPALAHAQGEAIPLVPVDTSDAGPAPLPTPSNEATPAPPLIVIVDAGSIAIPLVPIVDAGPSEAGHLALELDAGHAPPAETDAGLSASDAGAPSADGGKAEPDNPNFVKGELSHFLGANRITEIGRAHV